MSKKFIEVNTVHPVSGGVLAGGKKIVNVSHIGSISEGKDGTSIIHPVSGQNFSVAEKYDELKRMLEIG